MKTTNISILLFLFSLCFVACNAQESKNVDSETYPVVKSETEWKKTLDEKTYNIMFKKATEPAFTGEYNYIKDEGTFLCAACKNPLFKSEHKYDSRSGWPSFFDTYAKETIKLIDDSTLGMERIEVVCANCGGHLGHVFDDGPKPTGLRYCVNSASLQFTPQKK